MAAPSPVTVSVGRRAAVPVDRPARGRRGAGPDARGARGGTILGFMIGLILGLLVAVVVALFVTRAPVPFVNKAARAPERVSEPKSPEDTPDPNKPLYSKTRPAPAPAADTEPKAAPEDRGSILERLFGRRADDAPPAAEPPPVKGPAGAADAKGGVEARTPAARITESKPMEPPDRTAYLLQAGAFRGQEDADAMRARLALVGFEARVISAEVNGQTMYRVRVGPFAQLDDMNKARARLAENGIEASVVRQK